MSGGRYEYAWTWDLERWFSNRYYDTARELVERLREEPGGAAAADRLEAMLTDMQAAAARWEATTTALYDVLRTVELVDCCDNDPKDLTAAIAGYKP